MITNERQYKITRSQTEKLKAAIESFGSKDTSSSIIKARLSALQSELESLLRQIHEYESLKSGQIEIFQASTLSEIPKLLIKARIAKGLSQRELANLLHIKEQQIQRYESEEYGSASLNRLVEIAKVLELNITEIAKFKPNSKPIEATNDLAWDQFPIKEMYRRNWFEGFSGTLSDAITNAEELIKNYVKDNIDTPVPALARQKVRCDSNVNPYSLLAWQCRVLSIAKKKSVENKYNRERISKEWLAKLAHLSCLPNGPQEAVSYLRHAGIRLVIEPHLPNTYLDGASFLPSNGPVIALTLRYDRLDNFWFVLFHELMHLLKHIHMGKIESIFDDLEADANDIEKEADDGATDALIPNAVWETALPRFMRSEMSVLQFSKQIKVHPAIVAGKIRQEIKNYTILNKLIGTGEVRILFKDIEFYS